MKAVDELAKHVGVKPSVRGPRRSPDRRCTVVEAHQPRQQQPRPTPARALSETERGEVFDTLCSERFVDRSPAEVVAIAARLKRSDLCSERTMYRVLASEVPVQERRAQRTHPEYKKPELMATAPNQVWSWDITRLLVARRSGAITTALRHHGHLQPLRRGLMVADRENSALSRPVDPAELPEAWRPAPGPDPALGSGSSNDEPMAPPQLLADLGVTRSLSRPQSLG